MIAVSAYSSDVILTSIQ